MCETFLCHLSSPFGQWEAVSCKEGLHKLSLEEMTDLNLNLSVHTDPVNASPVSLNLQEWMSIYFKTVHKVKTMQLPSVCQSVFERGRFKERVWQEIYENLHLGETASYGEIAKRLESPRAFRAVGTAMKTNPVSLVIPCHRVVRAGGQPGHYHGGNRDQMKIWLLQHEQNNTNDLTRTSQSSV